MPPVEVSVVMPCLNEADTIGDLHREGLAALRSNAISGEVIVADNGSTDGSVADRRRDGGARRARRRERATAGALMGGIAAARGASSSWATPTTATISRRSPDSSRSCARATISCRAAGCHRAAGRSCRARCPFLHRWFGNPMFSLLARRWFRAPIHDVYCGLRGFTKELCRPTRPALHRHGIRDRDDHQGEPPGARIGEVPITLHPDGRAPHAPHLRTFRDGWRTLRFFLLFSPRWLFLVPGRS